MKVAKPINVIDKALYRGLSKIPATDPECFELKITVTPKGETSYNIAIGFTEEELLQLRSEIDRELKK